MRVAGHSSSAAMLDEKRVEEVHQTTTRRAMLITGFSGLAGAAGLGALAWHRRRERRKELYAAQAVEVLQAKAPRELSELPTYARDQIRPLFHRACLNSAEFVRYTCSNAFAERLAAQPTTEAKQRLITVEFLGRVVTPNEIRSEVERIAGYIGKHLDGEWQRSCELISRRWNSSLPKEHRHSAEELLARVEPLVGQELAQLALQTPTEGRPPASQLAAGISAAAMLSLRVGRISPQVATFLFVVTALAPTCGWILKARSQSERPRRRALSSQLAGLSDRVGAELVTEVRSRIQTLHEWQRIAMGKVADEVVPLF